jgi:hypothetical protein
MKTNFTDRKGIAGRAPKSASIVSALIVFLLLALAPPSFAQSREIVKTDDFEVKVGGYMKNLTTYTYSSEMRGVNSLSKVRLKLEASWKKRIKATLHYEIAMMEGESLKDEATRDGASGDPDELLDFYWGLNSDRYVVASHTLDRAYLSFFTDYFSVMIGRQRIAWGVARFISPTDLFNPFDPADIDKEEKVGVDALLVEVPLGDFSGLSLVLAPTKNMDYASYAFRIYANFFDYDFGLMTGRFKDREVYGFDFSGQVGEVAIFGEFAYNMEDDIDSYIVEDRFAPYGFSVRWTKQEYIRAVFGAEYVFPNTLSVLLEYYYNGKGEANRENYDFMALAEGRELTLGENYVFSSVGYEFTPLVRGDFTCLYNIDDQSALFSPSVEYSATENLYFKIGVQIGVGDMGSEYRLRPDLYYFQVRYYF